MFKAYAADQEKAVETSGIKPKRRRKKVDNKEKRKTGMNGKGLDPNHFHIGNFIDEEADESEGEEERQMPKLSARERKKYEKRNTFQNYVDNVN